MASLQRGLVVTSLAAATTGSGTAYSVPHVCTNHTVLVSGSSTISSGVVSIEEAATEDYTGTWSVITTITGTTITGGAVSVVHFTGLVRAIRARVSTTIAGGGSVSADIVSS